MADSPQCQLRARAVADAGATAALRGVAACHAAPAVDGAIMGRDGAESCPATRRHVLVESALEFIAANSHEPLSVQSVSDELGVTRRTLERAFAETHRRSIAAEISARRLERAQQLLGGSTASVKEIGYATGFAGSQRLIRAFRREFGITPLAFRRALHHARAVADAAWAAPRRALECISGPPGADADHRRARDPGIASAA